MRRKKKKVMKDEHKTKLYKRRKMNASFYHACHTMYAFLAAERPLNHNFAVVFASCLSMLCAQVALSPAAMFLCRIFLYG